MSVRFEPAASSGSASAAADGTTAAAPGAPADGTALPEGVKPLRQRHVTMIALGGIIGASLFVGSGQVIRDVGPAAILSCALGGLLVVLVMRMLGEMATTRPAVGSFMEYARIGPGPWAGYSIGWLSWYFWVGVIAFEAVVAGDVLHGWLPDAAAWLLAAISLLVLAATNLISLRSFGETEFWLASIKVATIIVFLIVGALFVLGLWPNATFAVPNLWQQEGGFMPNGIQAVIAGVAVVIFSYFGTEIATMAGAESDDPARGIKRATNSVIWRIMLFYVGGVTLLVMMIPWATSSKTPGPFVQAFEMFGIPYAGLVIQIVVLTAAISVLNSGIYSASRMPMALSHKSFAPKALGRRSGHGVPTWAVLVTSVVVLAIVAINYALPKGAFDFIMNSAGAVALFVYAFIAVTQMVLRNRMPKSVQDKLQLRMWLHPWGAILVMAMVAGVVVVMLVLSDDSRQQVLLSLGCFALLLVLWRLVHRTAIKRGVIPEGTPMFGRAPGDDKLIDESLVVPGSPEAAAIRPDLHRAADA
ncbi:GABA permease [Pseudoclavibacter triregionum]|nr:GABA permease [Pseudoclavibacter triregionum]